MSTATDSYRNFRRRTAQACQQLEHLHACHLVCKAGCHDCCVNLTVFPVEYYAILEDLRSAAIKELTLDDQATCAFLKTGLCQIYDLRPTICRTHGLPVAFVNDDPDDPAMNVSFCPLNFTQAKDEDLAFGPESTLELDSLNMELYELNLAFLDERPELKLDPSDRIPLKRLADELKPA